MTTTFSILYCAISVIQADQTCYEPLMCSNQTLTDPGHTAIGAYNGAIGTPSYTSFSGGRIDCSGSYSCTLMAFIKAQTGVYCRGFGSCDDTMIQSISSFIYCYGSTSCRASNMTTKDMICVGYQSCANAYIHGVETIYAGGSFALYNATIDTLSSSYSNITILLQSRLAAYGASLICRSGHICKIYCEAFDSCHMFYLNCVYGTCIIIPLFPHYNIPTTDLTIFNNRSTNISIYKLFATEITGPFIDASCILAIWAFDTAGERYNTRNITVITEIEGAICCRAEWSCYSVDKIQYQTQKKGNLICSGSDGCRRSNMSDIDTIFCDGLASCADSTINNTKDVYCSGRSGCERAIITGAHHVVCRGRSSCYFAILISAGRDLIVYLEGYYSAQFMAVYCNSTDICNIYCLGSNACYGLDVNCDNNCIIHTDQSIGSCDNPTSEWILATSDNLHCIQGTFQYKYFFFRWVVYEVYVVI